MKLFVLLSRVPYPLEKGDKLRAYHQIKILAQKHEVHLCCLTDHDVEKSAVDHLEGIVHELHIFKLNKLLIGARLLRATISEKPFQVHYFYQNWIQRKINALLDHIQPDHIYCQLIRCTEYVKHYHQCNKTIDYMDALSAGHRRRIKISRGIHKQLLIEETKRLTTYENRIFNYFENHTIISTQDRDLIYHEKKDNIVIVPNGVDGAFFKPISTSKKYDLLFTGNMNYPPNVDGVIYLVRNVIPLLEKSGKKPSLLIAGANPAKEVLELDNQHNIKVSGWVEDIRDAYNQSSVFVAPMQIGSGLQNKLLEALSMALPCVTTPLAANAFSKEQREVLFIGDSPEALANQISSLLDSLELRAEAGEKGRNLILQSFGWESTVEKLDLTMSSSK
ncbi:MAG: glycosyltransferase [Flavobacteriales bacterium]